MTPQHPPLENPPCGLPCSLPLHAPQAIETLLALDFAEPVRSDVELGQRLAADADGVMGGGALGLMQGASPPVVVSGDALKGWLAQPDDVRVDVDDA